MSTKELSPLPTPPDSKLQILSSLMNRHIASALAGKQPDLAARKQLFQDLHADAGAYQMTVAQEAALINQLHFGLDQKADRALRASLRSQLLIKTAQEMQPDMPWQKVVSALRTKESKQTLSAFQALDLALAKKPKQPDQENIVETQRTDYQQFISWLRGGGHPYTRRAVLGGLSAAALNVAFYLLAPKIFANETTPADPVEPTTYLSGQMPGQRFSRRQLWNQISHLITGNQPADQRPAGHANLPARIPDEPETEPAAAMPEITPNQVVGLGHNTQITITRRGTTNPISFRIVETSAQVEEIKVDDPTGLVSFTPQLRPENNPAGRLETNIFLHSSSINTVPLAAQQLLNLEPQRGDIFQVANNIGEQISIVCVGKSKSITKNQYLQTWGTAEGAITQAGALIGRFAQNDPIRQAWNEGRQLLLITTCDPYQNTVRDQDENIIHFNNRLVFVFLVWNPLENPLPQTSPTISPAQVQP